jgi:hypothetical protein
MFAIVIVNSRKAVRPAKDEVGCNFDRAFQLVVDTIRKQSAKTWRAAYSAERNWEKNRFAIILSCAAHADHRIGQSFTSAENSRPRLHEKLHLR